MIKILEKRKRACKGKASGIPKDIFPMLLKFLHDAVYSNAADNFKSGFEKCELGPLNKQKPLAFLPSTSGESSINDKSMSRVNESLVSVLQNMRYDDGSKLKRGKQKQKKLNQERVWGVRILHQLQENARVFLNSHEKAILRKKTIKKMTQRLE